MNELYQMIVREKRDILLALLAGTVSGLTAVALFAQSGFLISKAALMPPFYIILILTAFLKLFGVAKSVSKYAERYISHRVTFQILSDIRMKFFKKLTPHANQLLSAYRSGELLARITSDVDVLQNFFLRVVYPPLVAFLVFLSTIFFTQFFSIGIALVLVAGYVLVAIVVPAAFITTKQHALDVKHQLTTDVTELLYGYRELKLHNQLHAKMQDLTQTSRLYSSQQKAEQQQQFFNTVLNQAISLVTALFVVIIGAYFVSIGSLDGLFLAMLILIALTVFETAIPLALVPAHYNAAKVATARLDEVTSTGQTPTVVLRVTDSYKIQLQNVGYTYVGNSKPAVENVSFSIKQGEKIAIVGPSGSGKSTLFQLLTKSLHSDSGQILINEQHLADIEELSLWHEMSIQLQHNHFFTGTIRENLQIAKEHASDAELRDALACASLSKPLDDLILEKGGNLSGGEKQRLAFARVVLKNGAIWLLDEPFTNVDARTAQQLTQTLFTAGKDKTILMITHKLLGLEQMDRIFVMRDGKLIESGSYEALMAQRGAFFDMRAL